MFLPCFVSRLGDCVPTWHHGDRVLSVGHLLVRRDDRLRVTGYYGLVISKVDGQDRGTYRCHVDYQGYVQQVQHNLEVLGKIKYLRLLVMECEFNYRVFIHVPALQCTVTSSQVKKCRI